LKDVKEKTRKKLDETLVQIGSKSFDKVNKGELEHAMLVNQDVKAEVEKMRGTCKEQEEAFENAKADFERSQERLRQNYISEV